MRRRGRRRSKALSVIVKVAFVVLIVLFIIFAIIGWGYYKIRPHFSDGVIQFSMLENGLWISWPELSEDSRCRLYRYDETEKTYILIDELNENEYILPDVTEAVPLQLKFQVVRDIEDTFGKVHELKGDIKEVSVIPVDVKPPVIEENPDVEQQKMTLQWPTSSSEYYEIIMQDENGDWHFKTETTEGFYELDFSEQLELPDRDAPLMVAVRSCYPQKDGVFYSDWSDVASVERRELMPDLVTLDYERIDECNYRLSWNESKGDLYEIQQWSKRKSDWEKLAVLSWNEVLEYETGRLSSNTRVHYRVISYNTNEMEEKLVVAEPGEIIFRTDLSTQYCTIWPIIKLDVYDDSFSDNIIGSVDAGTSLCILDELNGRFRVMYNDEEFGYIDSDYCMINLPEFLGDLCKYDITNSYSSIFRVHEHDIPYITETVIKGYENIQLENDDFLVPYLYPCAVRLRTAAVNCQDDGYCLKIYDAFRPNEATRFLFDTTMTVLDFPVAEAKLIEEEEETAEGTEEERSEEPTEEEAEEDTQEETEESGESIGADGTEEVPVEIDLYDGLLPDALAVLINMTPEEQTLLGLTPETVAAVSTLSAESLLYLKNITPEILNLLIAGEIQLPQEYHLYVEALQLLALADMTAVENNGEITGETEETDEPEYNLPVYRIDPAYFGITVDVKGTGVPGLPADDLMVWLNLPADQLLLFKSYLENTVQSYYTVMTDGRYRLGSFLAEVTSAHNRGIALDLTIEKLDTGEVMPMQTSMHDLSWFSALPQNNENADLLAGYMKEVGFSDLTSEWWHFQDDITREELGLNSYLNEGVSVEGWKKDAEGWYYRQADGSRYISESVEINGKVYDFNEKGYCER